MSATPVSDATRPTEQMRPKKSLGQHFLTDRHVIRKIAAALEASPHDTVIEIGAGNGSLTRELAATAGRVIAIELDDRLAEQLRVQFAGTNVDVVHGDALEIEPVAFVRSGSYLLAGNLPYNIAQPLLRHYLEARQPPERIVVMVQSEVADSMIAAPGQMSLLSVAVQLYGEARLLFRVPAASFRPPPKVRSAVIRIEVAPDLRAPVDDTESFFDLVRAGFSTRRKQLRNGLANGLGIAPAESSRLLTDAGIDPRLRPQSLSLDQWAALWRAWTAAGRPGSGQ